METVALREILRTLQHWPDMDVRMVPGVMCQIRCGDDEEDPNIEYQMNWFLDCTETLIHNHRHAFDSFCLEGEYLEKLWEIVDDGTDDATFRFHRLSDQTFGIPTTISGTLRNYQCRRHFPGNILHVNSVLFHSITPMDASNTRVFTFLKKQKRAALEQTSFLSSSSIIDGPIDEMRAATEDERQIVFEKLLDILQSRFKYSTKHNFA